MNPYLEKIKAYFESFVGYCSKHKDDTGHPIVIGHCPDPAAREQLGILVSTSENVEDCCKTCARHYDSFKEVKAEVDESGIVDLVKA